MDDDIEVQLHSIYDELMEKPNRIMEIFCDFYSSDRVDMQGFPTYEVFKDKLNCYQINSYFNRDCPEVSALDDSGRDLVSTLFREGAGSETIFSDKGNTTILLPLIKSSVGFRWFQDIFILVHFPNVRITNEYDRFIDITHLWAKVMFDWKGKGKGYFGLNRSEYPAIQFLSGYMHSHVSSIPKDNFTRFQSPCTGSGPINSTMATLSVDFDDAIWQLFCLELDKYVRVESIAGIPYHKLENIGVVRTGSSICSFSMRTLISDAPLNISFWRDKSDRFLKHLLESKVLSFNYQNNQYGLAMSWVEYIITISNSFIEWYNKEFNEGIVGETYHDLLGWGIIREVYVRNNKIYNITHRIDASINDIRGYIGKKICTFKGEDITLNITNLDFSREDENVTVILDTQHAELILGGILRVLNYNYGRNNNTEEGSEEITSSNSTKRYL